jgi:hypothetical protein
MLGRPKFCNQNAKFRLPLSSFASKFGHMANCRKIKARGRFLRLNLSLKTQNTLLALRYGRLSTFLNKNQSRYAQAKRLSARSCRAAIGG